MSDDQLGHLRDDPLPEGLYEPLDRAIVAYARQSTRMEPIGDELYAELEDGLGTAKVIELCATVGLANLVNRFHATFLTDVDQATLDELGQGDSSPSVPLSRRPTPGAERRGPQPDPEEPIKETPT